MAAPMLPEFPNLTKCRKCETIVMLSRLDEVVEDGSQKGLFGKSLRLFPRTKIKNKETEQVRELKEYQDINSPFIGRYECMHLGIGDLYKALDVFPNDELYIRLKIWREYNGLFRHRFFDSGNISHPILDSQDYKDNCCRLLNLLNKEDDDERLIMAELNRNLGNFTECLDLIQKLQRRKEPIKRILTLECERGNRCTVRVDNYFKI